MQLARVMTISWPNMEKKAMRPMMNMTQTKVTVFKQQDKHMIKVTFQFYHKLKKLNQVEMNKQELIFLEKLGLHVLATLIEYF